MISGCLSLPYRHWENQYMHWTRWSRNFIGNFSSKYLKVLLVISEMGTNNLQNYLQLVMTFKPIDFLHCSMCSNGGEGLWHVFTNGATAIVHYCGSTSACRWMFLSNHHPIWTKLSQTALWFATFFSVLCLKTQ